MTSIYNNRLNEKTQALRRHTRAVIHSHLGKDLTAKDRESLSLAYQASYDGMSFKEVRGSLLAEMTAKSTATISATILEQMNEALNPHHDGSRKQRPQHHKPGQNSAAPAAKTDKLSANAKAKAKH